MKNHFIKATFEYCTLDDWVPAPYIRKKFSLGKNIKNADIKIAVLGFYRLWINGTEITKGLIAPYISNTNELIYYDCYDIKKYLSEGENVIGIMLGNGIHNSNGGAVWQENLRANRTAPSVSAELCIDDENGERVIVSDDSFKVHPSPVLFDDFRTGERYDANLEIDGWNTVEFDDSLWGCAISAEIPSGELKECTAEPIKLRKTLTPCSIEKQDGGYLYKFSENSSGLCLLSVDGKEGQTIELTFGEMLKDGKLTIDNITFPFVHIISREDACQKVVYTCREGMQTYKPSFTFHGFQYVFVSGITDEQATEELLTYELYSSDIETVGGFECSDAMGNTIQQMTINSDKACFFYYPMDCPHREKNGWAADAVVSSDHMLLNYAAEKSFAEWLTGFRKGQLENGKVPVTMPNYGWGNNRIDGVLWEGIVIAMPYDIYKYTQDKKVLEDNAHTIFRYLYYLGSILRDGIITYGSGDWCRPHKEARAMGMPIEVHNSIIGYSMCVKAERIFRVLNKDFEADYAASLAKKMRNAIREKFVDFETFAVKGECQTIQSTALYYGIFNADEEEKAFGVLMDYIRKTGNLMDVGILGARVMFHVLARFGEAELAYNMITDPRFPSWAYMANKGSTTFWEYFFDDSEEPYGSLDHHMFGSVSGFFIRELGGIQFHFDGSITINPKFIPQLQTVKASCRGICVQWSRENGEVKTNITAAPELKDRIR